MPWSFFYAKKEAANQQEDGISEEEYEENDKVRLSLFKYGVTYERMY